MANTNPQTGYAPVNGLRMYYEVFGTGRPLVVLHGAYMTIETMGEIVPSLAESRQVIAVELQAHGHTADIDRPLTYEHMADDVAALLRHLGIEQADIFGFSTGGVSPFSSPSATLRWCASWWPPLPPTLATACNPSC
jgi:pimeloyl-ACP methyl ester carboxylesterase